MDNQDDKQKDADINGKILQFIKQKPACHLRQIKKELKISMGTTQYHLEKLKKEGKITSTKNGLYKYYFPIGIFHENEKNLLQILTQETPPKILMFIIEKQNPTQNQIVESIAISTPSVNWHLSKLIDYEVIYEIREGKYKRYKITDDPRHLVSLMKNYYPHIWDHWSNRLVEIFLSLSYNNDDHNYDKAVKDGD